ncbi:MAG: sigma-70 family RNA polymerase sigma factor [FCB group bacterium]|jgi:RNA polymerase sigma-70 factor (ECF subfamily)
MQNLNKNNPKESIEEDYKNVRAVLSGDSSSFQHLQKKYKRIIASLIRKMVRNEDDVEDLTQETFIKAYNRLSSFNFSYAFSGWIYRIASNTCIDFLRKKRFTTVSLSQPIGNDEDNLFFEIEDNSTVPDLDVLHRERKQALDDAIKSLPENYREIIKLRHEEDLDYTEIAVKLDLPLGTVKAHLFRARKILYTSLVKKKYLFEEK